MEQKTTSKDIVRLIISLGLCVFVVGIFLHLVSRFGPNPMAKRGTVTIQQLLSPEYDDHTSVVAKAKPASKGQGQVAGVTSNRTFTTQEMNLTGVTKGPTTVELVRTEVGHTLRYDKKIYTPQAGYVPQLTEVENADLLPWKPLFNAPKENGVHEVFSLLGSSDGMYVLFVMRYNKTYEVYYYVEGGDKSTLKKINTFTEEANNRSVPKISGISGDGRYATLAMFACAECAKSDIPDTVLVDLNTGKNKNIGKTAYFNWDVAGNYQYKEYREVDCPDQTTSAKCAIDPQFLPFITGKLE